MKKVHLAGLADIHVRQDSTGSFHDLFRRISEKADVLVLAGDLTDLGLQKEAEVLVHELRDLSIPVVGVLGNHDYQSDQADEVIRTFRESGMYIIDTEEVEILGIGFAGTKGFGGGFEKYSLGSFGEPAIKQFVQQTLNETLNLENQLKKLDTPKKIVIMHYSPIRQTLEGEPPEIYTYLGSSRFIVPIEYFEVSAVFHGHAHHGSLQGKTPKGIPVYNVAHPLLQKYCPDQPFTLVEI